MLCDGLTGDRERHGEAGHGGRAVAQQRLEHAAPGGVGQGREDLAELVAQAATSAKLATSMSIGNEGSLSEGVLSVTITRVPAGAATTWNSTRVAGSSGPAHHQTSRSG